MAIITTSTTKDFSFLDWEGKPGYPGDFTFDAEPGTLLALGQKDIRKGRGGVDGYRICMPGGVLVRPADHKLDVIDLRKMSPAARVVVVQNAIDAAKPAPVAAQPVVIDMTGFGF
jgi:hypothetical protein